MVNQTALETLKKTVTQMAPQFQMALPKHITTEKFTRSVLTALANNPTLAEADRTSFLSAVMKSAEDGLICDNRSAALVTFRGKDGTKVQYMPMMAGILKKIRNSGELASLSPHVVYSNDVFEYWVDEMGEHLKHKPVFENRGSPTLVYCIARTKDGAVYIEVMTTADVERVRNSSRAKDSGPWVNWWDEMAKKTVIRRLAKRLPSSTDIEGMFEPEDMVVDEPSPVQEEVVQEKPAKKTSRLKAALSESAPVEQNEAVETEKVEAPI